VIFEDSDELVGELVDLEIEHATGFSLYGRRVAASARLESIAR